MRELLLQLLTVPLALKPGVAVMGVAEGLTERLGLTEALRLALLQALEVRVGLPRVLGVAQAVLAALRVGLWEVERETVLVTEVVGD